MKGGGAYQRRAWGWGIGAWGLGWFGVGDKAAGVSVGGEKVWLHRI